MKNSFSKSKMFEQIAHVGATLMGVVSQTAMLGL